MKHVTNDHVFFADKQIWWLRLLTLI